VVILEKPDDYYAVSQAYLSFYNLTDEDALKFMQRWEKEKNVIKEAS
jgi:predicted phosphoribosyltransferase